MSVVSKALARKKPDPMTTNYMIESMDGNSLGEGFGSREEAAKAAQAKADHLNQIVYVVRGDGHPFADDVSPRVIKAALQKLVADYGDIGLVQNVAAINAGIAVIREIGAPTRISTSVPLQTVGSDSGGCDHGDQRDPR